MDVDINIDIALDVDDAVNVNVDVDIDVDANRDVDVDADVDVDVDIDVDVHVDVDVDVARSLVHASVRVLVDRVQNENVPGVHSEGIWTKGGIRKCFGLNFLRRHRCAQ